MKLLERLMRMTLRCVLDVAIVAVMLPAGLLLMGACISLFS